MRDDEADPDYYIPYKIRGDRQANFSFSEYQEKIFSKARANDLSNDLFEKPYVSYVTAEKAAREYNQKYGVPETVDNFFSDPKRLSEYLRPDAEMFRRLGSDLEHKYNLKIAKLLNIEKTRTYHSVSNIIARSKFETLLAPSPDFLSIFLLKSFHHFFQAGNLFLLEKYFFEDRESKRYTQSDFWMLLNDDEFVRSQLLADIYRVRSLNYKYSDDGKSIQELEDEVEKIVDAVNVLRRSQLFSKVRYLQHSYPSEATREKFVRMHVVYLMHWLFRVIFGKTATGTQDTTFPNELGRSCGQQDDQNGPGIILLLAMLEDLEFDQVYSFDQSKRGLRSVIQNSKKTELFNLVDAHASEFEGRRSSRYNMRDVEWIYDFFESVYEGGFEKMQQLHTDSFSPPRK